MKKEHQSGYGLKGHAQFPEGALGDSWSQYLTEEVNLVLSPT